LPKNAIWSQGDGKVRGAASCQAGDILAARIIALVELGVLEKRGNLMNIWESEVRLRRQPPSGGGTV